MLSNDVTEAPCRAMLLTPKARLIAPLVVVRRADDDFLLLTEPGLGETVGATLLRARFAAKVEIEPEEHTSVVVFGEDGGIPNEELGEPGSELLDADVAADAVGRRGRARPDRVRRRRPGERSSTTRSCRPRRASTRRTSRSRRAAIRARSRSPGCATAGRSTGPCGRSRSTAPSQVTRSARVTRSSAALRARSRPGARLCPCRDSGGRRARGRGQTGKPLACVRA